MMDSASPEDRERLANLGRQLAGRESASPADRAIPEWRGPTQTFDVRDKGPASQADSTGERTIAQWLTQPQPGGTAKPAALPPETLRRASQSAQEAIEQQSIPPRHADLVKRVFRRYTQEHDGAQK